MVKNKNALKTTKKKAKVKLSIRAGDKNKVSEKALCLISSGIDSPVAASIAKGRGLEVVAVHFDNQPFTDKKQLEKTRTICKKLGIKKLYVIPHGKINAVEIIKNCDRRYNCILCRRMMFRVAEKIAALEGCGFLITGENLGQVASQTLDNLKVVSESVKIPILRPILCNDKDETKLIAMEIGTYDTSILPGMCCSHVPKHPCTKAKIDYVLYEERKLNIPDLVSRCLEKMSVELL